MKYSSKQALLGDIRKEHDALWARVQDIPRTRWRKPGVWGDEWTIVDLLAHLAEWQFMFLRWHDTGLSGAKPDMPAPGYKWNETPRLNRAIWQKHKARSAAAVVADFNEGYERILTVVNSLSDDQLLKPGSFAWTGAYPLTTYLGPNTASHYRFASKALKRWCRSLSL